MTRYQLVFRTADGDRVETRDNTEGVLRVGKVELIDGAIFAHRGTDWLVTREDAESMIRFICTPASALG